MVQRPRGTRDFGPKEMQRRLAFESLLEEQARRHGFSRIQTPIFESLDLSNPFNFSLSIYGFHSFHNIN